MRWALDKIEVTEARKVSRDKCCAYRGFFIQVGETKGYGLMAKRKIKRWKFLVWQALSKMKRAGGVCAKCGKTVDPRKMDAHHIVPKSKGNYAMFEKDNIIPMCGFYCHRNWWHGKSTWDEQKEIIEREIGLDRYWEIKRESNKIIRYDEDDYARMLEEFTK